MSSQTQHADYLINGFKVFKNNWIVILDFQQCNHWNFHKYSVKIFYAIID